MISPSGTGEVPDDQLDPYSVRFSDNKDLSSREEVQSFLENMKAGKSFCGALRARSTEEAIERVSASWKNHLALTPEARLDLANYHVNAIREFGVIEGASLLCFKF